MKLTTIGLTAGILFAAWDAAPLRAQPAEPPAAPAGPVATNADLKPKIQFADPIHDFGKIKVNEPAKHAFVFTNVGQAVLEITAVNPGCGCTTAGEWSRRVDPGNTGTIPIQYNAAGGPGPFGKTVNVTCNDPAQQTVVLQIKGVLWKPVEVNPQYAMFNVNAESVSNATSIVRIINNEESALTVSPPESNNPSFAAELTVKQPGKEYEVVVRPVPPLNDGNAQGVITLKTSSTNMPIIHINAAATVQPLLAVSPATIVLPPPPNTNAVQPVIYVRNNGNSPFSLSDPVVNAQGVNVEIKEIEPGRYASLTLTFPPEFTIAPGEKILLNVKTGLPHNPNFEVPVFQRPARVN